MKNLINILFTCCALMVVSSCVDDDKLFEIDDFETGALPNLVPTANDNGFINLTDLDNVTIEFTIDFSNNATQSPDGGITSGGSGKISTDTEFNDVSSVDLEVLYNNSVTGTVEKAMITNFTSWPVTATFSADDLVAAFPSITSRTDLNLGDQFVFLCGVNLADGRVLPATVTDHLGNPVPNYSVNFNGAGNNPGFNFSLPYNVSCPSNIPTEGTWAAVSTSNVFGTSSTNTGIVITSLGSGNYTISDVTAGIYATLGAFNVNQPVTFSDVCNSLTMTGNGNAQFNVVTDAGNGFPSGTWDPNTETITFPWYDAGNGFGDVTVLTRE